MMANERLIHLGRQAPSRDATGISLEPGARLYAWTPNHQQVSNCKVAVLRACRMNEGALDTTPQISYEEKMAIQEARQAERDAATRARTAQVMRRLKAEKGQGNDQTEKLERKQQRLQEFNARVKSGNTKRERSPRAVIEEHASSGQASAADLVLDPPCNDLQGVSTLRDWCDSLHQAQHTAQQRAQSTSQGWGSQQPERLEHTEQDTGVHFQPQHDKHSEQRADAHWCGDRDVAAVADVQGHCWSDEQEDQNDQDSGQEGGNPSEEDEEEDSPTVLLTARARLLSHCSRPAAATQQQQQQQRAHQQHALAAAAAACEGLVGASSLSVSSAEGHTGGMPRLARVFREVPQFMQPKPSPTPFFKGHIMPRYIHLSDRANLQRAKAKVADMGKACPPLCSCGSGASSFGPAYTASCARNCPLFGRPDLHEALLNRFLQSAGVI